MKKQIFCFIRIFMLIAVMCAAIASCSQPAVVKQSEIREGETKAAGFKEVREIRIDKVSDTEENITFVLNGFNPPKTHLLPEEPSKIVCDFPDTRISEHIKPTIEVNGVYLKRIRLGIQEETPWLRVVLEMMPNRSYSVKQTFYKKENHYTLTLTTEESEKTKPPVQQTMKSTEAAQNEIEEAKQLNQQMMNLYKQKRFAEAVPIAQKALSIREKALGAEHPDTATSLNNLAALYDDLGDYAKAEPLYKRALQIREKTLGTEHPDTAQSLNNLASHYYNSLGDYAKAEPLYQRALQICEKALGDNHTNTAKIMSNLAELYYKLGDYAKAESLLKRALQIYEKALGAEHPHTATILNGLANLYSSLGDYAKAEPLYKRVLLISEKVLGAEHPSTESSLNSLAGLYYYIGDYAKAEPLLKRALQITEKAKGAEHPDTAKSLNNLAMLYQKLGDYAKAEPLFKRALLIREKALGAEHPDTATSLNNLAEIYRTLGDYAKAEQLLKRALQIIEKALGAEHPYTALSLNNLARLYHVIGDYAKAEPLFKRALQITEKALGAEHPYTALSLNSLAGLYYSLGDHAKAEPLHKRALQIREKVLGAEHPHTAASLNSLAMLYYKLGDHAKAEPLYKRALLITEKVLGAEHPDTALRLNNLAVLHDSIGDYAKAEPLYKRALQISEKALRAEHPDTVGTLNNLGIFYAATDDFEKAHHLFKQVQQSDEKLIDQVMGFTSEEQKTKFIGTKKGHLYSFFSLVIRHLSDNPSAKKEALDVWLKRKGIILESQKKFQEMLASSDNPEAQGVFEEYSSVRAQLAKLFFAGPGKEGPEVYQKNKAKLEAEKQDLEAKMSRLSQAFASRQKTAKADTEKIAKALPADSVLLEFAQYDVFNFKAKGQEKKWEPAHYLAFVLHSGRPDDVSMIDLGEAEKIDSVIAKFRRWVPDASGRSIAAAQEIYELVFKPLKQALGHAKTVFISPDGNLNLIPFESLADADGRFLIEDYTFNYIAAGRDILAFGDITEKGGKPLLIGDPDFDMETAASAQPAETPSKTRSADMRGLKFDRLPGTLAEVSTISSLMGQEKTLLYTDKQALDEVLMKAGTPRILHLATHGFFLEDQDLSSLKDDDRGIVMSVNPKEIGTVGVSRPIKYENPLLRSGIAFAGANKALIKEGDSQGIVTADKILGLKLRGTDMVVLSACETGVGDVQSGEGVYGLRRAFVQAGTKSLVMSLWSVPDTETKEFMTLFYQNILSGKMSKIQAFRDAVLKQKEVVTQRYGKAYPFYWAAFVFLGEAG